MSEDCFRAGNLANHVVEWRKITSDPKILDIIQHCHIEFNDEFAHRKCSYFPQHSFNLVEKQIIQDEIQKLSKLGVIVKTVHEDDQFISPIFIRPKKNGEFRMVINLKNLNRYIPYHHFKMDTFERALSLVTKDTYFTSVDLRHAYYSVPIAKEHQRYLKFEWEGQLYQFTCFPNGLALCPRYFTKILKPVYAKLRNNGHSCSGFIDDSMLCGASVRDCERNCQDTQELFNDLGFTINHEKSIVVPTKQITHLGNDIDSEKMIVTLPKEKRQSIKTEAKKLILAKKEKIRTVARVIGMIVASFSAVEYGKMHYRELEKQKIHFLKMKKGNYEAEMHISESMKKQLQWWVDNVDTQCRKISHGNPDITIQTDASHIGYGMVLGSTQCGGKWSQNEKDYHINALELLAILYSLKAFVREIRNKHVRVLTDSTTAMSYVNNMGGSKSSVCNDISLQIWNWCNENNVWISCNHIPGRLNKADAPSRKFDEKLEWMLNVSIFKQICDRLEKPTIDLFASRLNRQLPVYCAWKPDPEAKFIDALSIDWKQFSCIYLFPPFSLLNDCIRKIVMEKGRGLIIAPLWPTQTYFSELMKILIQKPLILPSMKNLLSLPEPEKCHPLLKNRKLILIACLVSGETTEIEDFQEKLPELSWHHGELVQKSSTKHISKDGYSIAVKNKFLQFQFL